MNTNTRKYVYAVMGATGHIGGRIAKTLLPQAQEVRVLGRELKRLQPLVSLGAKPYPAPFDHAGGLIEAFSGVDAVFVMIPPDYQAQDYRKFQNRIGEAIFQALKNTQVKYVVNLSSVGAHLAERSGVVNGLYDQEQRLNVLSETYLVHLRPAFFMENQFHGIPLIKTQGIIAGSLKTTLAIPMIATQDIAQRAAELLKALTFSGHQSMELLGQRDLSMREIAAVLGKAVGKPSLSYVEATYEDVEKGMIAAGLSPNMASLLNLLNRGFNEGYIRPTEIRSANNTTPTSIETFATTEFAGAYNAS